MWWKHEKNYVHLKLYFYIPLYWHWQQQASFSLQIACVSCKVKRYDNRCFPFYSLQLCCMSHVSGVQNKYQISNHSCGTKQQAQIQVCHVGFSSVNRYKLHILSKIACVYLTFNTGLFVLCLSPWKQFFTLLLYKALCKIACFSFI